MKCRIKEYIKKRKMKIGSSTLSELDKKADEAVFHIVDRVILNAKLSGRKVIKKDDIQGL